MFHYQIINSLDNSVILDSSLRKNFDGYSTAEEAYMVGLEAKNENRLSDLHKIITFPSSNSGFGGIQRQREKEGFGM